MTFPPDLDALPDGDAARVPDALDEVVAVAGSMARLAAEQLVRVDGMRREALGDGARYGATAQIAYRSLRLELAAALRVTEYAADALLTRAEALVNRHPAMLTSLAAARTTQRHAQIFVDLMGTVEQEHWDRIVPTAVALAEKEPVGVFRRALQRLIETVRARTLPERHAAALQNRRALVEAGDDGMAWLLVHMPHVEAHAIHGRVTAMAKVIAAQVGETRTVDQIRADIIGDLLVQGWTDALPGQTRGIRATVAVTVPVLTLLDTDGVDGGTGTAVGNGGFRVTGAGPAVVEGVGPIPTDTARELCGGSEGWMRVLTDPETGMVLSLSRDRYRPPAGLRRAVRWRSERCMAPGCGIPATRCHIDHTIDWNLGGHTSLLNLAPLCEGHHTLKHHGGWTITHIPGTGGALLWTSPTGRRYRVNPERPLVTFQPSGPPEPPPF